MKNVVSVLASALVFGLAGCSLYSAQEDRKTSENEQTVPADDVETTRGGASSGHGGSSGAAVGVPSTSVSFQGPFVIGDGTGSAGDTKCQSSLGAKTPPATGALELAVQLSGKVTQLQVKAGKLCGGDNIYGGQIALMKGGATIAKKDLAFADSEDIVRDSTVTFTAEDDEAGFEPGDYTIAVLSDDSSYATSAGAYNEIAVGSIEIGVIGSGKVAKVGAGPALTRSEVEWNEAFSVGDNAWQTYYEKETDELACRSSLGAGAATSNTKRFSIEIAGDVTDLAFELEKTCGGNNIYQAELRVYEGDNLLLVKSPVDYDDEPNVISSVMHVNARNAGRELTPGVYTLEVAAEAAGGGFDDVAVSGVRAWVIGKNASVEKR